MVNLGQQFDRVYMGFGQLVKRYAAVVLFPTISFGLIFADWNHTRKWKLQRDAAKSSSEELTL